MFWIYQICCVKILILERLLVEFDGFRSVFCWLLLDVVVIKKYNIGERRFFVIIDAKCTTQKKCLHADRKRDPF